MDRELEEREEREMRYSEKSRVILEVKLVVTDDLALVHRLDGEGAAMKPEGDIEREKKGC